MYVLSVTAAKVPAPWADKRKSSDKVYYLTYKSQYQQTVHLIKFFKLQKGTINALLNVTVYNKARNALQ